MSKTVLIIEDDQAIRETLSQILEIQGYTTITATNGKEGLEILNKMPPPCLIFLDLMMPVMNGLDFLKHIEESKDFIKIPIVIISAFNYELNKINNLIGFVKKPLQLDILSEFLERYC